MERPRVYLSGAISAGDRNKNFHQAAVAHKQLMLAGYAPFNPMLSMLAPFAWEKEVPHGLWLECDFPWVEVADVVWRLPGYSVGADAECSYAILKEVPVVYDFEELEKWRTTQWFSASQDLLAQVKTLQPADY